MEQEERAYYIDWIKIGVVLLLVPFHAAISFTIHGDVPIKYPVHVPVLEAFMAFLSIWMMPILFLISGMSSYYSLRKRTGEEFMRERLNKLLIPYAAGFILTCPVISYIRALFIGSFDGSLLQFYPHFFNRVYPEGNFSWWHLWFLLYLFIITLILRPVFVRMNENHLRKRIVKLSARFEKGFWIYLIPLPVMIIEMIIRPLFHGAHGLISIWSSLVFYLLLVFMGFCLAMNEKVMDNIERYKLFSLALGAMLSVAIWIWPEIDGRAFSPRLYHAYITFMTFAWMYAILGHGKAFFNMKSKFYSYLNDASFPFYILHYLPVTLLAFFMAGVSVNVWAKYVIIVLGSYAAAFALYEVIRRMPLVGFLFGIKSAQMRVPVE